MIIVGHTPDGDPVLIEPSSDRATLVLRIGKQGGMVLVVCLNHDDAAALAGVLGNLVPELLRWARSPTSLRDALTVGTAAPSRLRGAVPYRPLLAETALESSRPLLPGGRVPERAPPLLGADGVDDDDASQLPEAPNQRAPRQLRPGRGRKKRSG
jgi:hypothetical protein